MYINLYICIYIYLYIYVYKCIYIYDTHVYIYIYVYTNMNLYIYTYVSLHTYIHSYRLIMVPPAFVADFSNNPPLAVIVDLEQPSSWCCSQPCSSYCKVDTYMCSYM